MTSWRIKVSTKSQCPRVNGTRYPLRNFSYESSLSKFNNIVRQELKSADDSWGGLSHLSHDNFDILDSPDTIPLSVRAKRSKKRKSRGCKLNNEFKKDSLLGTKDNSNSSQNNCCAKSASTPYNIVSLKAEGKTVNNDSKVNLCLSSSQKSEKSLNVTPVKKTQSLSPRNKYESSEESRVAESSSNDSDNRHNVEGRLSTNHDMTSGSSSPSKTANENSLFELDVVKRLSVEEILGEISDDKSDSCLKEGMPTEGISTLPTTLSDNYFQEKNTLLEGHMVDNDVTSLPESIKIDSSPGNRSEYSKITRKNIDDDLSAVLSQNEARNINITPSLKEQIHTGIPSNTVSSRDPRQRLCSPKKLVKNSVKIHEGSFKETDISSRRDFTKKTSRGSCSPKKLQGSPVKHSDNSCKELETITNLSSEEASHDCCSPSKQLQLSSVKHSNDSCIELVTTTGSCSPTKQLQHSSVKHSNDSCIELVTTTGGCSPTKQLQLSSVKHSNDSCIELVTTTGSCSPTKQLQDSSVKHSDDSCKELETTTNLSSEEPSRGSCSPTKQLQHISVKNSDDSYKKGSNSSVGLSCEEASDASCFRTKMLLKDSDIVSEEPVNELNLSSTSFNNSSRRSSRSNSSPKKSVQKSFTASEDSTMEPDTSCSDSENHHHINNESSKQKRTNSSVNRKKISATPIMTKNGAPHTSNSSESKKDGCGDVVKINGDDIDVAEIVHNAFQSWQLPEETLKKIRALDIELILNTPRMYEQLKLREKNRIEHRHFSIDSIQASSLKRRWEEFCSLYGFDHDKPNLFFMNPVTLQCFSTAFIKYFVSFMTQDIPFFNDASALKHFEDIFKTKEEIHKFTNYEDKIILALNEKFKIIGSKKTRFIHFAKFVLNRCASSIYTRRRVLLQNKNKKNSSARNRIGRRRSLKCSSTDDTSSTSSDDEQVKVSSAKTNNLQKKKLDPKNNRKAAEDKGSNKSVRNVNERLEMLRLKHKDWARIVDCLLENSISSPATVENLRSEEFSVKDWRGLSSQIGIPAHTAKAVFQTRIHPLLFSTRPINKHQLIVDILHFMASSDYNSWDDVEWCQMSKKIDNLQPLFLFTIFVEFAKEQVPLQHQRRFKDCLNYLLNEKLVDIEEKIKDQIMLEYVNS